MSAERRAGPADVEARITRWGLRAAVWAQHHPWWASLIVSLVTAAAATLVPRTASWLIELAGAEIGFFLGTCLLAAGIGLFLGGLLTLTRVTAGGRDLFAKALAWLGLVFLLPLFAVGGTTLEIPADLDHLHAVAVVALCSLFVVGVLLYSARVVPLPVTRESVPRVLAGLAGVGLVGGVAGCALGGLSLVPTAVLVPYLLVTWVRLPRLAGRGAFALCAVAFVLPLAMLIGVAEALLSLVVFVGALPTAAPSRFLDRVTAIPLDHPVHDGRVR